MALRSSAGGLETAAAMTGFAGVTGAPGSRSAAGLGGRHDNPVPLKIGVVWMWFVNHYSNSSLCEPGRASRSVPASGLR